jgi:lysyl-tRNA synthetase class II
MPKPYYTIEEFQGFVYKYTQYVSSLSPEHREQAMSEITERFEAWIKDKRAGEEYLENLTKKNTE